MPCCSGNLNLKFIRVGGQEVAVSRLDEILDEANALESASDEQIKRCLMDALKEHNYVPREAERDYADAIWRVFVQRKASQGDIERPCEASSDDSRGNAPSEREIETSDDNSFHGLPRNEIDWSPRVDVGKCTGCGTCVEFCHQRVFNLEGDRAVVVSPLRCIIACTGCVSQCPEEAICFPSLRELNESLKSLREKHGFDVQPMRGSK